MGFRVIRCSFPFTGVRLNFECHLTHPAGAFTIWWPQDEILIYFSRGQFSKRVLCGARNESADSKLGDKMATFPQMLDIPNNPLCQLAFVKYSIHITTRIMHLVTRETMRPFRIMTFNKGWTILFFVDHNEKINWFFLAALFRLLLSDFCFFLKCHIVKRETCSHEMGPITRMSIVPNTNLFSKHFLSNSPSEIWSLRCMVEMCQV